MNITKIKSTAAAVLVFAALSFPAALNAQKGDYPNLKGKKYVKVQNVSTFQSMADSVKEYIAPFAGINVPVKIENVYTFRKNDSIYVCFNRLLADYPMRAENVRQIYSIVKSNLPEQYKSKKVALFANNNKIEMLVTPFYGDARYADKQEDAEKYQREGRLAAKTERAVRKEERDRGFVNPIKEETTRPYTISAGLQNKHIAMSNSHGWFYEPSLDRWEFQRARLFGVVEDTYTMSYVVPFLTPMLENAGAVVMMPKERDWNLNEVIVDNDTNTEGYRQTNGAKPWHKGDSLGFANPFKTYTYGQNPFRMGTYMQTEGLLSSEKSSRDSKGEKSEIAWIPNVPQDGDYAVYISYHSLEGSTKSAHYTVRYSGGEAQFDVNQQIAGGIWVYLGTFRFEKGNTEQGVYLSNSNTYGIITADACKFGGGMSNIARGEGEGFVSGMPRFMEGAKYWLQWSGFPDTVYSYSLNVNGYNDDYVSRGKWVNRLAGGSSVLPNWGEGGLKVPVDLSFAFHTDAGNFMGDSIVGTLSIYTRTCNDFGAGNTYADGTDRIKGRYLADMVQTQLVEDISALYGFQWTRRGLWDRSYSESRTPQVPAMLLEFLSHHNFADMKFGLDPDFRFSASRAIYKGILKFLSYTNNEPYIVQPLPVSQMQVTIDNGGAPSANIDSSVPAYATVSWSPVADPLEATAKPTGYVVYTAVDAQGYNRGVYTEDTEYRAELIPGKVYRFKVTAVNEGGESFPSEVVAAGVPKGANGKVVMIVNAFDRVGAPKWLQSPDSTLAGFFADYDHGVPYIKDASYLGKMYEFRRDVPWTDDDAPGFGACYNDYAGQIIAGNTFDYAYDHGIAFMQKGYSFVSSTRSAVEGGKTRLNDYQICDIILGKQAQSNDGALTKVVKYAAYTPALKEAIKNYCASGRNLLLSGAYVATELVDTYNVDSTAAAFAADVLKFKWMTHSATKDGKVAAVRNKYGFSGEYQFYSELNDKKYVCEAPDALVPASKNAYTVFRYPQTSISAAVAYPGTDYKVVTFGFPIETLKSQEQINSLIGEVVEFFER